jgi:hypothetical protein
VEIGGKDVWVGVLQSILKNGVVGNGVGMAMGHWNLSLLKATNLKKI